MRDGEIEGLSLCLSVSYAYTVNYFAERCAASSVFFISIAMVMGPTPPGTGVTVSYTHLTLPTSDLV